MKYFQVTGPFLQKGQRIVGEDGVVRWEGAVAVETQWIAVDDEAGQSLESLDLDGPEFTAIEIDRLPAELETVDETSQAVMMDVAAADAFYHAKVDRETGAIRRLFITDISGQEGTYQEKEKQALRFLAGDPEGAWSMIRGGALARGWTDAEFAQFIVGVAAQWRSVASVVENARDTAKVAISAASTCEEKAAAATIDWDALLASAGA